MFSKLKLVLEISTNIGIRWLSVDGIILLSFIATQCPPKGKRGAQLIANLFSVSVPIRIR